MRTFFLRLRRPVDDASIAQVEETLADGSRLGGPAGRSFVVLGVLSSTIAALGLLLDNAAAVIGAMLLGPFMVPLLAVALALLQGHGRALARAAATLTVGVALSVGAAWIVGWLTSPRVQTDSLKPQLLALTRPGLLDLGIALAAGIAAGHATVRPRAGATLTGVAVSVTLEPPLAAVGLFLHGANHAGARHAALAFATNFLALVTGAIVALAWGGLARPAVRIGSRARARAGLALWVVSLGVVAVPLTIYSRNVVATNRLRDAVDDAVEEWDPSLRVLSVAVERSGGVAKVEIEVSGPATPPPAADLAGRIAAREGTPVELDVTFTLVQREHATAE